MDAPDNNLSAGNRILVTGSNGQLGKELKKIAPRFPQFDFIFLTREDLPIHHFDLVRNTFKIYHPQFCINGAAYTAVDRAQQEKERAFHINGEAVGVLAAICKDHQTRFLHISTDYVFDGASTTPYTEEAPAHPLNVYGSSKREGEIQAIKFDPGCIIIRSSWLYSEFGKNFVKTMLKMMNEQKPINVVNDQLGSPTYAHDLAEVIMQVIVFGSWQPGIYHYCNKGIISWYDFALTIRELAGLDGNINPVPSVQYPTAAKRPAYTALDCQKIRQCYGIELKDWKKSLGDCLQEIIHKD